MEKWYRFKDKIQASFSRAVIKYFGRVILVLGTCWILVDVAWTSVNIYDY